MSDKQTIELEITVPAGDWWTYAGILKAEWPRHGSLYARVGVIRAHGCTIAGDDSRVEITGDDRKTTIAVTTIPAFVDAWRILLTKIEKIGADAYEMRRAAVGLDFKHLLKRYYAAKARGERPKLAAMAADAGLNYNSLRQYKKEFDKKQKQQEEEQSLQKL